MTVAIPVYYAHEEDEAKIRGRLFMNVFDRDREETSCGN
jgi:hypothetical protein